MKFLLPLPYSVLIMSLYLPMFRIIFIVLCWICLRLIWFLTDSRNIVTRISSLGWVSICFVVVIVLQLWSFLTDKLTIDGINHQLMWLGYGWFVLGWLLAVWAKVTMNVHWGEPGKFDNHRQTKLVTEGPFRISRNPIYLGLMMMVFGSGLILNTYLFFTVLGLFIYIRRKVLLEEQLLSSHFGDQYLEYKEKVRRWI